MDLILWRHADAERGGRDEERRLTTKGRKQAKRVAAWLRERLPQDATVLTSPVRRAVETAEALTDRFRTLSLLDAGSSARQFLAAAGWPRSAGVVVAVGHQPTLGRAAALILTGAEADWRFKKGAIWWFEQGEDEEGASVALRAVVSPASL
jgi:phosphohistidine phosphatase